MFVSNMRFTVGGAARLARSTLRTGRGGPIVARRLLAAAWLLPGSAVAATPINASTTTPAALADQATLCSPATGTYPTQRNWAPLKTVRTPRSATIADHLRPRVVQHRMVGGRDTVVAVYRMIGGNDSCYDQNMNQPGSFLPQCGPFSRGPYRTWLPGDVYLVYPAVYSGALNNPWVGAQTDTYAEYVASTFFTPTDITIRGVVQNGIRPVVEFLPGQGPALSTYNQSAVFFSQTSGVTWDNIDVVAAHGYAGAKAAIVITGSHDLTISNSRVMGFHDPDADGILGGEEDTTPGATDNNSGTLSLLGDELGYNGGVSSSYDHNVYIGASGSDPNFKVEVRHMWSHDVFVGHTLKIRAQNADVQGSYFEGSVPPPGSSESTDAYLLDFPNGGNLIVKNDIFAKNASGPDSNGISLTYAMEGVPDSRPLSIDYENNTFVAFSEYFDGSHPLYPMGFFYPNVVPGTSGFPVTDVTIKNNAFVGYCPQNNPVMDFRGDLAVTEGFSERTRAFSFRHKFVPAAGDAANIGAPAYGHVTQRGVVRATPVIGAED